MGSRATHAALVGTLLACAWAGGCGGREGTLDGPDAGGVTEGGAASTGSSSSGSSSGSPASSGASSGSSGGAAGSSSGSSPGGSGGGGGSGGPIDAGPAPVTCAAGLAQLGGCLSYVDFTAKNAMGYAASDFAAWVMQPSNSCLACHSQGNGGFWLCVSNDPMLMFQNIQRPPCIQAWVGETCNSSGDVTGFAPSSSLVNQSQASMGCMKGMPCHPAYQVPAGLLEAMDAFVNDAVARWQAGKCSTSASTDAGGD